MREQWYFAIHQKLLVLLLMQARNQELPARGHAGRNLLRMKQPTCYLPSSCALSTEPMSLLVAVDSVSELSPLAAVAAAALAASPVLAADLLSRPSRKLMSLLLLLVLCVRDGFLSRSRAYV